MPSLANKSNQIISWVDLVRTYCIFYATDNGTSGTSCLSGVFMPLVWYSGCMLEKLNVIVTHAIHVKNSQIVNNPK